MARAKRTDRAEARRRYRATLVETDQADDAELDADDAADAPARAPRARPAPASAPPARQSMVAAFRGSFRPVDVRADIRALPSITLHSKAIWVPVLLTAISTAAFIAMPTTITELLFQYFVYTPPIASIFIAGFMAPRASYLTGLIAGLAGAIGLSVAAVVTIGRLQAAQPGAPTVTVEQLVQASFFVSPIAGLIFGGAAGWYKRFLRMASPNRATARPGDRNNRRRDQNDRPLLARRR